MNLQEAVRQTTEKIVQFVSENAPKLLIGVCLSSGVTATITAVPATVKAVRAVDEKKKEDKVDKLTWKETLKVTWKYYIPPVLLTGLSIGTGIKALDISEQREAAAMLLYETTKTTLNEYKEKTKEIAGPKKEQQIHDAVNEEKIKKALSSKEPIYQTGLGDRKFIDSATGRLFTCERTVLESVVNSINRRINDYGDKVTLNDIFYELNMRKADLADKYVWHKETAPVSFYVTITEDPTTKEPITFIEWQGYEDQDLPWRY